MGAWNGQRGVVGTGEALRGPELRVREAGLPMTGEGREVVGGHEGVGGVVVPLRVRDNTTRPKGRTPASSMYDYRAWDEVRANQGAPGVDGITIAHIQASGEAAFLDDLAAALKAGTYRPAPLRRVHNSSPAVANGRSTTGSTGPPSTWHRPACWSGPVEGAPGSPAAAEQCSPNIPTTSTTPCSPSFRASGVPEPGEDPKHPRQGARGSNAAGSHSRGGHRGGLSRAAHRLGRGGPGSDHAEASGVP
jgi:hypothetical protein